MYNDPTIHRRPAAVPHDQHIKARDQAIDKKARTEEIFQTALSEDNTPENIEYLTNTVFPRAPEIEKSFREAAQYPRVIRAMSYESKLPTIKMDHWRDLGIPEKEIQTLNDHIGSCVMIALIGRGYLGAFYDAPSRLPDILRVYAMSGVIISDKYLDSLTAINDKNRVKETAVAFLAAGTPRFDETITLWREYRDQITPVAKMAHDIVQLEYYGQAQVYEQQYPDLKEKLEKFREDVVQRLKTEEGRTFLREMNERPNMIRQMKNPSLGKPGFNWRKNPEIPFDI